MIYFWLSLLVGGYKGIKYPATSPRLKVNKIKIVDNSQVIHNVTEGRFFFNPIDDNHNYLPSRCAVYAYCLMPNHVHLLIREKDDSLATVMKSIGVGYAWHYNKK